MKLLLIHLLSFNILSFNILLVQGISLYLLINIKCLLNPNRLILLIKILRIKSIWKGLAIPFQ